MDAGTPRFVRRATHADALAAARLLYRFNREYDEPAPEPPVLARRLSDLIGGGDTIVLLAGEDPVGVAVLRLRPALWSPGLECYLAELYVVPEQRGRGYGRALLLEVLKAARDAGADTIDLSTSEHDVAARELYASVGFTNREGGPAGPVMLYYEREL